MNKNNVCVVICSNSKFLTEGKVTRRPWVGNFVWWAETQPNVHRDKGGRISFYFCLDNKRVCFPSCPDSSRPGPLPPEVQHALFPPADPPLPAVHQPHLWRDQGLLRQPDTVIENTHTHTQPHRHTSVGALLAAVLPMQKLKAFFNKTHAYYKQ